MGGSGFASAGGDAALRVAGGLVRTPGGLTGGMTAQQTPGGTARTPPNLVDEEVFRLLLDLEVQKAMRLRYCVAVVLVEIDAEDGHAPEDREAVVRRLAELATRQLRATDVVATLSPSSIALLLIDAETPALPRILDRAAQPWEEGRLGLAGRDWRVRWSAGGGCYPQTATTVSALLRQAGDLLARAREEGGHRLCLPG